MDDPRRHLAREQLARVIPGLDPSVLERIPIHTPDWTGHTDSDPGVTLVELFAFLAENPLYRRMEPSAFPHTVENAGPLRDLLNVVSSELSSIRVELEKLYGDQFLETAGDRFAEIRFPGVFVEEAFLRAKAIPGVSTSLDPGSAPRIPGHFPVKVESADLNATANDVPIEPVELVTDKPVDPDPDD